MVRFVPRETKFFPMFEELACNVTHGARLLREILANYDNVPAQVEELKAIEHRGDELTHAIIYKLNQTFITPFDREDIHRLTSSLDDVLDFVNAAAQRLVIYKISNPPAAAEQLARLIVQQSEELAKAISELEKNKHVLERCVEVNRLEDEADQVTREAIGHLFENQHDPITLIKIKELLEVLEMATDKAEDVANVLEAVVLKSA